MLAFLLTYSRFMNYKRDLTRKTGFSFQFTNCLVYADCKKAIFGNFSFEKSYWECAPFNRRASVVVVVVVAVVVVVFFMLLLLLLLLLLRLFGFFFSSNSSLPHCPYLFLPQKREARTLAQLHLSTDSSIVLFTSELFFYSLWNCNCIAVVYICSFFSR